MFLRCLVIQVAAAIMPMPRTESATRARPEGLRPAEPTGGGPSAVMVVEQKQSAWQKQWQNMQGKVCFEHKAYVAQTDALP